MRASTKPNKLYHLLGLGAALLVPALAVGLPSQLTEFTAGTVISADDMNANFQAIAADLEDLRTRVAELEAKNELGARVELLAVDESNPGAIFEAHSDGMVTATPGGSGYGDITLIGRAGDGQSVDDPWAITCSSESCGHRMRGRDGDGIGFLVQAGQLFSVEASNAAGTATATIYWQPIHGEDADGEGPELVLLGTPP